MKLFFKLSLMLLALLLPATAAAYDFEVDGIYYEILSDNQVAVTHQGLDDDPIPSYTGTVTIPETVTYEGTTYSVTSIGNYAFCDCSGLTSVTIPNSVISIGNDAFSYCSGLTSVTIPNSVTSIDDHVFFYCSGLTNVTIPNSITNIGQQAFSGCSGLASITVASGNPKYDSRNNCNAVIETASNTLIVGCKNTHIPSSINTIGYSAFEGCSSLTSMTIPNSVTSIGQYAFYGCI